MGNFHFEDSEIVSELSPGGGGVGEKCFTQGGISMNRAEAGHFLPMTMNWSLHTWICGLSIPLGEAQADKNRNTHSG